MTDVGAPPMLAQVRSHRVEILAAVRRHHGRSASIFGSVARGDAHQGSDVDFLVDFEPSSSLFDVLHLKDDLERIVGVPVDVVSSGGLTARDEHIRLEAVPL